jgi:tRNA dimethylallyltransferase
VDLIRQHTRNYAKRQLTWFQKETGMKVFHPGHFEEIMAYLNSVRP